tara:strand:- start:39 stop:959 length:921 start_codon:yes stop_codon:yes gene_type:complete
MDDLTIKGLPVPNNHLHKKAIDPRLPQHRFRLGLIAPSYSGKTNLIISLIKEKRFYWNYFKVFIFSKSIHDDPIWDNVCIAEKYCCNELSEPKIDKILDHQAYLKDKYELEGTPQKLPNLLFIIDDMAGDSALSNRNSILNTLMFRGRHHNLSILCVSQAYKMLSKNIRTNFSDMIFYAVENDGELKSITEENSGGLSKKNFEKVFKHATAERFNFLYVARKYKGKKRFRKNFDTSLFIEDGKVQEEPLVLPYPKIKKKQVKIRPAKINYKPKPPKRKEKKQLDFLDFIEDESSSDEESTSSEYST